MHGIYFPLKVSLLPLYRVRIYTFNPTSQGYFTESKNWKDLYLDKKKKESGNIGEIRTKIISQTTWLVTFDHNPIEKDENYDISPNGVSLSQRFCKNWELILFTSLFFIPWKEHWSNPCKECFELP